MAVFRNNPRIQEAWRVAEQYRNGEKGITSKYVRKVARTGLAQGGYLSLKGYITNPNEIWVPAAQYDAGAVENPNYIDYEKLAAIAEAELKAVMKQEADKIDKLKKEEIEQKLIEKSKNELRSAQAYCANFPQVSNNRRPVYVNGRNITGDGVVLSDCMVAAYKSNPNLGNPPTLQDVEREFKAGGRPKQGGNSKPLDKPKGSRPPNPRPLNKPKGRR